MTPLVEQDRILDAFADDLAAAGFAGERRLAQLVYLVVTSRLLERIVSIAIKGPSSAGKSHLIERVLGYFPPSAYYALSAMSEKALVYDQEPLQHRMLVIYEAAGLSSDLATYMIRSLLSEGRVRYVTVEKAKGGALQPRLIDREGPTGLIVTTTQVRLHPENETRLLSLTVTDTAEQTRAILQAQASEIEPEPYAEVRWHELQEWLAEQDNRVAIPYAGELASLIPPVAVRLRRDFPAVQSLIRAHAVLHQATRERDQGGRIVAAIDDYAVVRELVADLVAEAAERTVPDTVRETVAAVAAAVAEGVARGVAETETTVTAVAERLSLDKSAALRRVKVATDRGYLRNLEDRRGRPARLVLGEPLPEQQDVLPDPEGLQGCRVVQGDRDQTAPDEAPRARDDRSGVLLVSTPSKSPATVQPSEQPSEGHQDVADRYAAIVGWNSGEPGAAA